MKYVNIPLLLCLSLFIVISVTCYKANQIVPTGDNDNKSLVRPQDSINKENVTLEERCKVAKDGDIIILKPGKYKLDKRLVIDRDITICAESPEKVILTSPDYCVFEILFGSPTFENLTVISTSEMTSSSAFEITGGTPKIRRCTITSCHGTGVHVSEKETVPEIMDCIIKECGNRGIFFLFFATGSFINCDIYGNQDNIEVKTGAIPNFLDCKIHEGKRTGIIVLEKGNGCFTDCDIYGNSKVEIALISYTELSDADPLFKNCKIHDGKIGVRVIQSRGRFENCKIFGHLIAGVNIALFAMPSFQKCKIQNVKGTGIEIGDSGLGNFVQCEIFENEIGIYTSGLGNILLDECSIYCNLRYGISSEKKGNGCLRNCNIYGNTKAGIHIAGASKLSILNCTIHNEKMVGVVIEKDGQGRLENNILENNPVDWDIHEQTGEISAMANSPEITEQK